MYKREAVLKKIEQDPAALNDPRVHAILHTCLMREKKILQISLRNYKKDLSLAEFAESELHSAVLESKKYREKYEEVKEAKWCADFYKKLQELNSELYQFFCDFEGFLKLLIHGVGDIETRIAAEEKALESKDPNHFQEFLTLWEQEINDNKELELAYTRIFNSLKNQSLLYKLCQDIQSNRETPGQDSRDLGINLVLGFVLIIVTSLNFSLALFSEIPKELIPAFLSMFLGTGGVALSGYVLDLFLRDMEPYMKYEFKLDSYDHEMIEKIKHHSA